MISHTVRAGETLGTIARTYLGSSLRYRELAAFNNLSNPNLIRVGQIIRIPEANQQALDILAEQRTPPIRPDANAPLPGVYELAPIEGSATRDWILPIIAAALAYWGLSR